MWSSYCFHCDTDQLWTHTQSNNVTKCLKRILLSVKNPTPNLRTFQHQVIYIWLSAERCTNGGSDFWLSIKSVSNTLSCCCFVCAFIIGQYHSGNNMSSKSGAAGAIFIFEIEKRHGIWPLKTDIMYAHGECFRCFRSHTWRIRTLPQSPICTEEILLYTAHIKLFVTKFCFWS